MYLQAGLLCGKCKENFSLILGSYRCEECSRKYLALCISRSGFGDLALFLLKLAVVTGTLYGLIFYANIVAVDQWLKHPSAGVIC